MKEEKLGIPSISLEWLDKLCGCIIIRDVEPQTMRNSSGNTLTETERISTHKICTLTERVIEGVEEKWSRWGKKVLYVLLKCIYLFPRWVLCNLLPVKKKYYFNPYNMEKKKRHMPMHKNKNKIILPG